MAIKNLFLFILALHTIILPSHAMPDDKEEITSTNSVRSSPTLNPSHLSKFTIPENIIKQILENCTLQTVGRFAQTCKTGKKISEDDQIWKPFLVKFQLFINKGIPYKDQVKIFYDWVETPVLLTFLNRFTDNLGVKVKFLTPEDRTLVSKKIKLDINQDYQFTLKDFVGSKHFQASLLPYQLVPFRISLEYTDENILNPQTGKAEIFTYNEYIPGDLLALTVRLDRLQPITLNNIQIKSVQTIAHNMGLGSDCIITNINSDEFAITPNGLYPQFKLNGKFLRQIETPASQEFMGDEYFNFSKLSLFEL